MSRAFPQVDSNQPIGGRYRIISQLGSGGFGCTFLAEDMHLPGQPRCVVKQLKPQTTDDQSLQMARRCFNTEAEVLYQLGVHDQIPQLLAHFEEHEEFYLVQEYVEGKPLSKELVKGKPCSEGQAITLLINILEVLSFVHQQNVIHRDLKPSNLIRRQRDDRIVLIDFGAVKQAGTPATDLETGLTNVTISIGTQGYMPNEQLAGKPRFSSDVYAVGVIGIQVLTGIHPRHLGEDAKGELEWHHRAPHVSRDLLEVLDKMVRYDFRDRYQTAIETLEAIKSLPIQVGNLSNTSLLDENTGYAEDPSLPSQPSYSPGSGQNDIAIPSGGVPQSDFVDSTLSNDEPIPTAIWVQPEQQTSISQNGTGLTQAFGRPYDAAPQPANAKAGRLPHWLKSPWFLAPLVSGIGLVAVLSVTVLPTLIRNYQAQSSPPISSPTVEPSPTRSILPPMTPEQQAASLLAEADRLRESGFYLQALELYDQVTNLNPESADAYWGKCDSLNELNRPAEAIVACNDTLAYQPNDPQAIYGKGRAFGQQDRWYEALKLFEQASQIDPNLANGWIYRGIALQRLGRSAEALVALDRGIRLDRNSAAAWSAKGEALWNLNRFDDAIAALDKALELQPDNQVAQELRQQARDKLGR